MGRRTRLRAQVRLDRRMFKPDEGLKVIKDAQQKGAKLAAEYLLQRANLTVPFLEGNLERSGEVKGAGDRYYVGYDSVYARYQHEGLDFVHTMPGRRAKWLELTVKEERRNVQKIIGNTIRRALG